MIAILKMIAKLIYRIDEGHHVCCSLQLTNFPNKERSQMTKFYDNEARKFNFQDMTKRLAAF